MAGGSSTPSTPFTCMAPTSGGQGAGHRACALFRIWVLTCFPGFRVQNPLPHGP